MLPFHKLPLPSCSDSISAVTLGNTDNVTKNTHTIENAYTRIFFKITV